MVTRRVYGPAVDSLCYGQRRLTLLRAVVCVNAVAYSGGGGVARRCARLSG